SASGTARTRMTRLLGAVGARLARRPGAPRDLYLWMMWLLGPRRRHTHGLVRRAAATPVSTAPAQAGVPRLLETRLRPDPHADALAAHVAALRAQPGRVELERLAALWDRALSDPETRGLVLERAAALGARSADRVLSTLAGDVAADLAELAR